MKAVVLGVDSSTQSCTLVARDVETGAVAGSARAPHPHTSPPISEQDPLSWWEALTRALEQLGPMEIKAISIDGQGHGSVLLDAVDEVIRPVKVWNDTSTKNESAELIEALGISSWITKTSIVPVPAFTICKLLWTFRHEPWVRERLHRILLPHDWLIFRLTGSYCTDRSEASGTGYFSPATSQWLPQLLEMVDTDLQWEPMLPALAGPNDIVGTVSRAAARHTGLHAGIPVAPGCNDNPASALGLGLRPSDLCISLGTSGTVFAHSDQPVFDLTGAVNGNADATGAFLPLVCTLNATKVTDWISRTLGVNHGELAQMAFRAPAVADRPILVPFFDGERTPNLPTSTGVLRGLRTETSREEIARAFFEGVLLGLIQGVEALSAAGVDISGRVILTGGGAASPAYVQLLADLIGRPVHVTTESKSAALGAAVQAAAVFHRTKVTDIQARWEPDLAVGAEPRSGQSAEEVLNRYRQMIREEVRHASSMAR